MLLERVQSITLILLVILSVVGTSVPVQGAPPASPVTTDSAIDDGDPDSKVIVLNVTFATPGNVSSVTVNLAGGSGSNDVEAHDIDSVTTKIWDHFTASADQPNATVINASVTDAGAVKFSFGDNITDIDRMVVEVTPSSETDGATFDATATVADAAGNSVVVGSSGNGQQIMVGGSDKVLSSSSTSWQGQVLYSDHAAISAGEVLEVRDNDTGNLVTQVAATDGGVLAIDTSELAPGPYYLEDSSNFIIAKDWEIVQQSLSASFADSSVQNTGSISEVSTTLDLTSNRGSFTVDLSSPDLSDTEIATIFGSTTVSAGNDAQLAANFSGIPVGVYTVDIAVTDANASGSAEIQVGTLTLSIAADNNTLDPGQELKLQVNADAGNRDVKIQLIDSRDNIINETTVTLNDSGRANTTFKPAEVGRFVGKVIDINSGVENVTNPILIDTQQFTYTFTLVANERYAVGFPGPINGTYGDVFGHFNGTIWEYDAANETWRHPGASETIDPLDAVYVIPEERATVTIDFADSESAPGAPGEKQVYAGWNFIGAPQYSGAETAFVATTTDPRRILLAGSQPGDQPFPAGDDFGWYAFGQDSPDPRVSAFTGYWVFMAGNGTVGANLYRGVTLTEAESLLGNESR